MKGALEYRGKNVNKYTHQLRGTTSSIYQIKDWSQCLCWIWTFSFPPILFAGLLVIVFGRPITNVIYITYIMYNQRQFNINIALVKPAVLAASPCHIVATFLISLSHKTSNSPWYRRSVGQSCQKNAVVLITAGKVYWSSGSSYLHCAIFHR